jgi:hypothetical protein
MRAVGRATVRSFFGRDDWLGSADASVTSRRFYAMMQASWLGMSQFIFGVVLFAWWSAWPLVAASLIAIVAWSVNMVLARRGQLLRSAGIVHLTVCSMAAVVVVYIGWDLGWQYALIVQMLVCILNPWPRRAAVLLAATAAVLFLGLYYYTQRTEPLVSVAPAVLDVLGTAIALGALGVACVMVNYPVIAADQAEAALAQEHDRSERLLANVLPRPVAARLKAGEEPITDAVPSASVLFADIVDFTPLPADCHRTRSSRCSTGSSAVSTNWWTNTAWRRSRRSVTPTWSPPAFPHHGVIMPRRSLASPWPPAIDSPPRRIGLHACRCASVCAQDPSSRASSAGDGSSTTCGATPSTQRRGWNHTASRDASKSATRPGSHWATPSDSLSGEPLRSRAKGTYTPGSYSNRSPSMKQPTCAPADVGASALTRHPSEAIRRSSRPQPACAETI